MKKTIKSHYETTNLTKPITFRVENSHSKSIDLIKSHYDHAVSEVQNTLNEIKGKEHKLEYSQRKKEVLIPQSSQKKIILHVPEKETKTIQHDSNEKLYTEIKDLEQKYASIHSKIEDITVNHNEEEDGNIRSDIFEMNHLMKEFEEKKLFVYKQKFQTFFHRLLKKFHKKKKKLLFEISELKKQVAALAALNQEYLIKIDFLEASYNKIKIEYEELLEIKKNLEEELAKYQKNEVILRAEIERLKALLHSKEKECAFFRERCENLENEKISLIEENKKYLAKITKYEAENALYKMEIQKLNDLYNERYISFKREIDDLQKNKILMLEDIGELKKENIFIKDENQKLLIDREKVLNDFRELEIVLKEKVNVIQNLQITIEQLEHRPPREVVTEIPVEKIIEKPVEKTVIVENKEIIEEFKSLQQIKLRLESENFSLHETIHKFQVDYDQIFNELNIWKRKFMDLEEFELRPLNEERNALIQRNMEAERIIQELREKLQSLANDMHSMQAANQEKNANIANYIQSLIRQNEYLEDLISRG